MADRRSRHKIITVFMAVAGVLLAARLLMLTVIQQDMWDSYADDMSKRTVYETGPRGDITDRNGQVLAGSRPVYSIRISKVDMKKETTMETAYQVLSFLKEMGEDISISSEEIRTSIEDTGYMSYMPVTLAEDVSADTAETIQKSGYPGVYVSKSYIREYPEGALASHIIGYLGKISEEEEDEFVSKKGYRKDALIGKSGIEALYENSLKGKDAVSSLQVDSLGRVTKLLGRTETDKGKNVKLTIDIQLQETLEEALRQAIEQSACGGVFDSEYGDRQMRYAPKAASGAAAAIDIKTGEVLAMASYPDFDPNDFAEGISAEKWAMLQQENPNDPLSPSPMYNIATMSAVQPGSTFKPVTAMAALSCGLDENKHLYDDGHIIMGERSFGCHIWNSSRASHGYVDLDDAMKVSCNYYFFDIASGTDLVSGKSLGYAKPVDNSLIADFAEKMGLGKKTGIELAESTGIVPSEDLKEAGVKTSLKEYLFFEGETYFKKSVLNDSELFKKKIEKIVNQADKDLTLNQLIGKLKKDGGVREDKAVQLAEVCKYSYFDQMKWTMGDTFNISIGQGDNAYTVLQMANYMATLGNNGVRNDVSLICDGNAPLQIDSEIDNEHIDLMIDALTDVTSDPGGDLYGMFASFPYKVAAKTGTAQRAGRINTTDERDYIKRHLHLIAPDVTFVEAEAEAGRLMQKYPDVYDKETDALRRAVIELSKKDITAEDIDRYKERYDNFAWTVAMAPADDPQIAVAVMLVQGGASSNAAPVVREIIGKYGEISRWEKLF